MEVGAGMKPPGAAGLDFKTAIIPHTSFLRQSLLTALTLIVFSPAVASPAEPAASPPRRLDAACRL